MKIQNKFLFLFADVLMNSHPTFADARLRDSVGRKIMDLHAEYEANRIKLCKGLADKDKKGKPVIIPASPAIPAMNGIAEVPEQKERYKFSEKNQEKFDKEFQILQDEKVDLPLKSGDAKKIVKIMEMSEYKPKVGEAIMIDENIISKLV